ncbi:MAG: endoglucanase [Puniceicoccaceae bacterium]|nr:MAG: endoglucanase [Puniceicoccaceae bacterium]
MKNPLPRWRGFNLLELFSTYRKDGAETRPAVPPAFRETDFQWIADWGFDFVRLPMSYHFWSDPERWLELDEPILESIDAAVELGRRHGLHVSLNLHRAPGYCVNPPEEPKNLWQDDEALVASCHHWGTFAKRYRGISSERLSFDLLNEPPRVSEKMSRADHERVIRALVAAIRSEDPDRLIIADGLNYGNEAIPEIADLGVAQSCRAYLPFGISHYRAHWVKGDAFPDPVWPGGDHFGRTVHRTDLEKHYREWAALFEKGVGVHCGEGGCYHLTPHAVFLDWFRDVLEILKSLGIGHALWNFRGPFGILDSGRGDVAYDDWHGHRLDRKLLDLLRTY